MFVSMTMIADLNFSIIVLSLIVLIDVFIQFKNPPVLKFFFLLLPFSIGITALINATGSIYFVFYVAFFKTCILVSILNIFSILYFPKFRKLTLISSLAMLGFTIFLILVNKNIIQHNAFTDRFRAISVDENLNIKINPLIRFIRFLYLFFATINIGYFWYVIYKKIDLNNIYYEKIKKWTFFVFLLICIIIVMNIVIGLSSKNLIWLDYLTIFISFYILILVLKRPGFLNHSAIKIAFGQKFNQNSEAMVDENAFMEVFYHKSYFTNPDASLENLAKIIKVNAGELSAFVHTEYQMTFNELVNKNRITCFLELVQDSEYQNFTIDALAKKVGFSSRQHLHKPFKKFHGGNPSDLF